MKKLILVLLSVIISWPAFAGLDNPTDTSAIEADIASAQADIVVLETYFTNGTSTNALELENNDSAWHVDSANHTNFTEYASFSIYPTNANYEITWHGPFDYALTLSKFYGKVDSSTCTVHVIEQSNEDGWRIYTTNNASIILDTNGVYDSTWTDTTVAASNMFGIFVINNGTASNATCMIKYTHD